MGAEQLYAIVDSSQLDSLDFSKLNQDNKESCRKSLDGLQAVVSFNGIMALPEIFSGQMLVEEEVVQEELYGPSGDPSLLVEIQEQVPFSTELINLAYAGEPKTKIKQVAHDALDSGIITNEEIPLIKQSLIRYAPQKDNDKVKLNKDFFDDVTGVIIEDNINFDENNLKVESLFSNIKSGDYEIEENFIVKSDQYFNLESINRYFKKSRHISNIDSNGNILYSEKLEDGSFATGIKYSKNTSLGPLGNIKSYNKSEIREILSGPDWSVIEPQITDVVPRSGSYGDIISITGDNFYNIEQVQLGDHKINCNNNSENSINFILPSVCSDGNISLLDKFDNEFNSDIFFDYINEMPSFTGLSLNDNVLSINGNRLDNVKFVELTPDYNNGEEFYKIGYPFFQEQSSSTITLNSPQELTGDYTVKLIDVENRIVE